MELHNFCTALNFDLSWEMKLLPYWDELYEHSSDVLPDFMKAAYYRKNYPYCQGPDGVLERMAEVEKIAGGNPVAARYAAMLHYALYEAPVQIPLHGFPHLDKIFGENAGIFNLMVAMSAFPLIRKTYSALGLPEHCWQDSVSWLKGTMQIYAAAHHGIPGHTLSQAYWIRHYIDGTLFRIGRLEYMIGNNTNGMAAVYVNRKDHSIIALALDNWIFDADGYRILLPGSEEPAFKAKLKILDGHIIGTPMNSRGFPITGRKVTLDLDEWQPLCTPWDLVPGIHIPGGGGMTPEAVKTSLIDACAFFRKYFSMDVKVFTTSSWIFAPVLEKELPDSNLAAFIRNVHGSFNRKHPTAGYFFVYGNKSADPCQQPCISSLHKAFCRIKERGDKMEFGTIFIPTDGLEDFGTEKYTSKFQFQGKK